MPHETRRVGRQVIEVPGAGEGPAHTPRRLAAAPGMWVRVAHFFTLPGNADPVYLGWVGTSAVPGHTNAIPVSANDVTTLEDPERDADGRIVPFDLYDLFLTGTNNGDGVSWFTW